MEKMGLNDIRQKFLKFFESKEHLILPSFSLVPKNDKSLLLINAGMAPLKPYFTGQEMPPKKRVTTCQKCIRTGDIERVGKTARHATFFEMLGNFSFGDYFKEEIIPWSWEFATEILKLPAERLWVTIYEQDDEAFEIWNKKVGVPCDRIVRMGKEDNFWEIGQGPCGPCSEIYFDRGEDKGCKKPGCSIGCDCDRFIEFWNLVFTQFDRDEKGNYNKLSNPNIDTGMGLERIATIMQEVDNIFEIDTMKNILNEVCNFAKVEYGKNKKNDMSIRIITDHIRSVTFMVSDGMLPSNEGRGYVLRRLLRRAARHGKLLSVEDTFLWKLCDVVIENSSKAYHDLLEKKDYIKKIIKSEEERFNETIDQGTVILNEYISSLKSEGEIMLSGKLAFKLYDTFGFPVELTLEILEDENLKVDMEGFNFEMEAQKQRARSAREDTNYMGSDTDIFSSLPREIITSFSGYDSTVSTGNILAIAVDDKLVSIANCGDEVSIILDNTSFYAEMGGQVGDSGYIDGKDFKIQINECRKTSGKKVLHIGKIIQGNINIGDLVTTIVDISRRMDISRNHTATHILQSALRCVLGEHVHQSGSLVTPDRLRFDFTHFEPLSQETLKKIELIVNDKIMESLEVKVKETSIDEANKMGATALFGEKYGKSVRVVTVGDFSMEFCGGTHVKNSSTIGMFKIVSEAGVAAGIRRIEAFTGSGSLKYVENLENTLNEIAISIKVPISDIVRKVESLCIEIKDKDKQIEEYKMAMASNAIDDILKDVKEIKGVKVATASIDLDIDSLRALGDKLRDRLLKCVVILASKKDNKIVFIAMATKDAVSLGINSGVLVREVAKVAGGGGGGKADMAQAGGKYPEKVCEALKTSYNIIEKMIK